MENSANDEINCCFFVDGEEENGIIRSMCLDCYKVKKTGWHYRGVCGPWEIKCHFCNKIIKEKNPA